MSELLQTSFRHRNGCFRPPPPPPSESLRTFFVDWFLGGDHTGIACPQCRSAEICYNGNYGCSSVDCGWAMCPEAFPGSDEFECRGCEELFNLCYLGLLDDRAGRDPRDRWTRSPVSG